MGAGRIARRAFLGLGIAAAGGLAVGYYFYRRPYPNPIAGLLAEGEASFNPYVRIGPDNRITVYAPRAEMGQNIATTLAALVAEELDVGMDQVTVEHGPASPAYFNRALLEEGSPFPFFDDSWRAEATREVSGVAAKFLALQVTGGSSSTIDGYERMRDAGAAARETLVAAAARVWAVNAGELRTERAQVLHPTSGRAMTYGELADTAAGLAPPRSVALREPRDWRLLGRPQDDVHGRAKVTGAPFYASDLVLPDMVFATVRMSPRFGARHARVDLEPALSVPGVEQVVPIDSPLGHGFGVIAANTWAAMRGAEALEIAWEPAPYPGDDAGQAALFEAALSREPDFTMGGNGDAAAALGGAGQVLEADYAVPFLAHATMEPMSAVAQFTEDRLTLWVGTQAPGFAAMAAARQLGIATEAVTVHTFPMGGGFGRRAEIDFVVQAAELARQARGRPVKLIWTRAEDMRHDTYRPAVHGRFRAAIVPGEAPAALEMTVAAPSVVRSAMGRFYPSLPAGGPDKAILDGLFNQPYAFDASTFRAAVVDLPIPIGFWRAVGNSHNGFFLEGFLDEIAHASGLDPLDLRLRLMGTDPRFEPGRAVLIDVTRRAGWDTPLPAGKGRGLAFVLSFGAWVGQVVQVDATEGPIRIEKVWCTADPGRVLDPRNYEAQVMSGIVFGLGQAMEQEITFVDGEVQQSSFVDFPILRVDNCPEIEVNLLENAPRMGGAGEVGTPPAAPALANAIFAATGRRLRRMPFRHEIAFA
jgi:isoquinoline 1-oxidoreductase beta subunit